MTDAPDPIAEADGIIIDADGVTTVPVTVYATDEEAEAAAVAVAASDKPIVDATEPLTIELGTGGTMTDETPDDATDETRDLKLAWGTLGTVFGEIARTLGTGGATSDEVGEVAARLMVILQDLEKGR